MSYKHLSIVEREKIAIYRVRGKSRCQIAKLLGRDKSAIFRELARNPGEYLPSKAQARYQRRRKKCRPHKLLENPALFALVRKLFLGCRWSPEQIATRLKLEDYPIQINYKTIYRAIYAERFDTLEQERSQGNRGARRKLRHKGKPHSRFGDWEADTIVGREFQLHGNVTKALGVKFYFPPPHQPWQRGTNENTNGLLREYFPKGYNFNQLSDADLQAVIDQLNQRPRKCLGYKTPA